MTLARHLRWAMVAALVLGVAVTLLSGQRSALVALGLTVAAWIVAGGVVGASERLRVVGGRGGAWRALRSQPRAWYGMHLAHIGVAVFVIGVTVVKGYESEKDVRMEVRDTVALGSHTLRFLGVREVPGPNYRSLMGEVELIRNGVVERVMHPEKRHYHSSPAMPMTEAAIHSTPWRDIYVSLGEPLQGGAWSVRVYYKPMVVWIWGGCVLMALGGLLAASDRRYRVTAGTRETAFAAAGAGGRG
jgi:cytochrome c-type biogenesis protein CcmF